MTTGLPISSTCFRRKQAEAGRQLWLLPADAVRHGSTPPPVPDGVNLGLLWGATTPAQVSNCSAAEGALLRATDRGPARPVRARSVALKGRHHPVPPARYLPEHLPVHG